MLTIMGSLWAPEATFTVPRYGAPTIPPLPFARPRLRCVYPSRRPALPCHQASGRSTNKEARKRLSAVAASLSSASPGEDSASELGLKIDLNLPRRRLQLSFTCDACGARSQRLINPDAYARGTVFVQCAGCEVYHQLVDNLGLIEEYDFRQETNGKAEEGDLNVLD